MKPLRAGVSLKAAASCHLVLDHRLVDHLGEGEDTDLVAELLGRLREARQPRLEGAATTRLTRVENLAACLWSMRGISGVYDAGSSALSAGP